MPGMPGPIADEHAGLIAFLAHQRYLLRVTSYGLTDDQARLTPTAGTLSIGGLIKHVARTEYGWVSTMQQQPQNGEQDYAEGFVLQPTESLAEVLAFYDSVAERTERAIAGIEDLGLPVPVPQGVPWFPKDVTAWSVRWVLLHILEETARHIGHADIVRESIDGATAFPLLAAVEKWPATPWLQPWDAGPRVLHLAHQDEWRDAQRTGIFDRSTRGLSLADVGFIHTSGADQVAQVANSYYADDPEPLLLLVIDVAVTEAGGSPLVWEDGGAGVQFPHIYGPIPIGAVVATMPVGFEPDFGFVVPDLSDLRVVNAADRA